MQPQEVYTDSSKPHPAPYMTSAKSVYDRDVQSVQYSKDMQYTKPEQYNQMYSTDKKSYDYRYFKEVFISFEVKLPCIN